MAGRASHIAGHDDAWARHQPASPSAKEPSRQPSCAWGHEHGQTLGLVFAFGHHSLVMVLTRCGRPLPVYFLADTKHSRCLTDKVYLPTMVCGRVL